MTASISRPPHILIHVLAKKVSEAVKILNELMCNIILHLYYRLHLYYFTLSNTAVVPAILDPPF